MFRRNWVLPKWSDIPLRGLKYVLLGLFGYAVASMDVESIQGFLSSPYGLIADVKMLNFFRNLGVTAAVVLGFLFIASVFVQNFWCRYLCPYGALMGLASLLSPTRIRRDPELCIDCAKCAKACPSHLPVDTLIQIRSAECLGCLECVAVCPADKALDLAVLGMNPTVERTRLAMNLGAIFGQRSQLWYHLPAGETFDLLARIYEIPRAEYRRRRDELVARFELAPLLGTSVRKLSLGQRIGGFLLAGVLRR